MTTNTPKDEFKDMIYTAIGLAEEGGMQAIANNDLANYLYNVLVRHVETFPVHAIALNAVRMRVHGFNY